MRTARNRQRLLFVLIASFLVFVSFGAEAAVKTWTGGGADANWSTAANWSPAGAPVAGDDLVFPTGGLRPSNNNDLAAGTSFNTISFTGPVGGYGLNGNAIHLVAGITANNSGAPNLIGFDVTLTASQTFTVTGDRLQLFGTVNLGTNTLSIVKNTFATVLELDGPITGTGGLSTTGSGFVYTQGTCTYTGPTNIGGGIFGVGAGSLSTASVVTVTGSGTNLQIVNGASVGPVTVGPDAVLHLGGGGISQIGNVTDLTLQAGSYLSVDLLSASNYGQVVASGAVNLTGAFLFLNFSSYTSTLGTAFTIVNKTSGGAVTGTLSGYPEGSYFANNGRHYKITYVGGDGNDVVVTDSLLSAVASAVPTLGTTGLAALGLLLAMSALFVLRRAS